MSLRPRLVAPLLAAAVAVALTGCGSDSGSKKSSSSSTTSAAAQSAELNAVSVTGGDAKTAPKIDLKAKPLTVPKLSTRVLKEGTGAVTTKDDIVVVDYVLMNGKDGATIDTNFGKGAVGFDVGDPQLIPGLRTALTNVKIGSRILAALPPADAFGTQGNTQINVGPTDTVVFLLDVVKATKKLPQATGEAVAPAKGLPTVVFNEGKPATITMPKTDPPKKLVAQPLIKGTGPKVKAGDTAWVTYTGAIWRDGKVFDSSFSHGATFNFVVGTGNVIQGWHKGVEGQTVGSRILLSVPPEDGYQAAGQGDIKGTDTIVFVIDIVAVT